MFEVQIMYILESDQRKSTYSTKRRKNILLLHSCMHACSDKLQLSITDTGCPIIARNENDLCFKVCLRTILKGFFVKLVLEPCFLEEFEILIRLSISNEDLQTI